MAREDDWTGTPIEDDDPLSLLEDAGLFEFDAEEDVAAITTFDEDDEAVIHVGSAANGAKSLREAAEMLYDFADELLELSGEGWEIVDDIANGHGVAVRFEVDEDAELGSDGG